MRTAVGPSGKPMELSEVSGLVSTGSGEVFFCTRTGLYRKTPHDPLPVQIPLPGAIFVHSATLTPETGTLWLATTQDGVWTLSLHEGRQVEPWPGSSKLTDARITVIARAAANSLWIGTMNGLNHVDPASGAVERINTDPNVPTALSAPNVGTLMIDRDGRLWVGTQGGGISILEGRDSQGRPRFRHLGLAQGLPNLNVNKILQAPSGTVWVATDNGLAVIDPQRFEIRALGAAEGAVISNYWVDAGAVNRDGTLAFGGAGGLTLVRPERLARDVYPSTRRRERRARRRQTRPVGCV